MYKLRKLLHYSKETEKTELKKRIELKKPENRENRIERELKNGVILKKKMLLVLDLRQSTNIKMHVYFQFLAFPT